MLNSSSNVVKIDGASGKYDNKMSNPSYQYGKNAVDNLYNHFETPFVNPDYNPAPILDFGINQDASNNNINKLENFIQKNDAYLDALPPLEYEYRYMPQLPNGQIDKNALMGAAYEEMGRVEELSVDEMDYRYTPNENYTSKALDLNNDGKVDMKEYSTSILAADMLSKSNEPKFGNIDGTINKQGHNAVLEYSKKSNAAAAAALYSKIYENYNLGEIEHNR